MITALRCVAGFASSIAILILLRRYQALKHNVKIAKKSGIPFITVCKYLKSIPSLLAQNTHDIQSMGSFCDNLGNDRAANNEARQESPYYRQQHTRKVQLTKLQMPIFFRG
jgi:hypothetical protein